MAYFCLRIIFIDLVVILKAEQKSNSDKRCCLTKRFSIRIPFQNMDSTANTVPNRDPDSKSGHDRFLKFIGVLRLFPHQHVKILKYAIPSKDEICHSFQRRLRDNRFIIWLHTVSYILDTNQFELRITIWAQMKFPSFKQWLTVWSRAENSESLFGPITVWDLYNALLL